MEATEPLAASVKTSGVCYFWTTGEGMTRTARDLCMEGKHEKAAKLLLEGLGMTWDQAYDLLAGKTRLNGDSKKVADGGTGGLGLEDDGPELHEETSEYLKNTLSFYAGRFRVVDDWYRPYAYVTGFNHVDLKEAYDGMDYQRGFTGESGAGHWPEMSWRRAMHYADTENKDRAHLLNVEVPETSPDGSQSLQEARRWVLFEKTNAPPPWLSTTNKDEAEALQDWLANGCRLETRGPVTYDTAKVDAIRDAQLIEDAVANPIPTRAVALALNAATRQERRAEEERQKRREDADEEIYLAKLKFYRETIRDRAEQEGGYITLTVPREGEDDRPAEYQVPRAPFEVWSLWRTNLSHLAPNWRTVCESGLKMFGDDATHTDWMLGAEPEMPLDAWHGRDDDKPLMYAALAAQEEVQARLGGFEVAVLCGRGLVRGEVIHPDVDEEVPAGSIIVIPHAGPEYAIPAMSAGKHGAIITENGGSLSHLAVLGTGMELKMVRIPDAMTLYPPKADVEVDLNRGRVSIESRNVRGMMGEYE